MLTALGSGITLYTCANDSKGVTHANQGFANITLDGNPNLTPLTVPISANTDNGFLDLQAVPYGNHHINLLLVDRDSSGGGSSIKFDYAVVNETISSPDLSGSQHSRLVVFFCLAYAIYSSYYII
jgi:hypothetical protein